jgi:hypothetical protein
MNSGFLPPPSTETVVPSKHISYEEVSCEKVITHILYLNVGSRGFIH